MASDTSDCELSWVVLICVESHTSSTTIPGRYYWYLVE